MLIFNFSPPDLSPSKVNTFVGWRLISKISCGIKFRGRVVESKCRLEIYKVGPENTGSGTDAKIHSGTKTKDLHRFLGREFSLGKETPKQSGLSSHPLYSDPVEYCSFRNSSNSDQDCWNTPSAIVTQMSNFILHGVKHCLSLIPTLWW